MAEAVAVVTGFGLEPLSPGGEGSQPSSFSASGGSYWATVARLMAQVADGLDYAHKQGIQHRDIKPANLLLDLAGTVWITDFGLAKSTDADDLTNTGDILGTLRYMAPERFEGHGDERADIYALGLTLYELLTLTPAFSASNRAKLVEQVIAANPPRPRSINIAIPRDLETVVLKAIARDPAMRYQTAGALQDDLQRYLEDRPITARRASSAEQAFRWCRRNPAVAGLLAAVLLVFAIGASVSAYFAVTAEAERVRAEGREREADAARIQATEAGTLAQDEATKTRNALADSYGATGLNVADPGEAMVWFAKAAEVAGPGSDRERLNRERLGRWDASTPKPVRVLDHKDNTLIQKMVFHPGGLHLLTKNTTSKDWAGIWRLWDVEKGTMMPWPAGVTDVTAAAWNPTGQTLALGTQHGDFVLAAFPSGEVLMREKRGVPVTSVAFDGTGNRLAFVRGIHIEYIDVPTRKLRPVRSRRSRGAPTSELTPAQEQRRDEIAGNTELAFAPSGEWLYAVARNDVFLYRWDEPKVPLEEVLNQFYTDSTPSDVFHRPPPYPQFAGDGRHLLFPTQTRSGGTSPNATRLVSFDPIAFELKSELKPDTGWSGYLTNYALSPDGRHAFVATSISNYLFDLRTGKPMGEMHGAANGGNTSPLSQAFTPDGRTLYTAWTDGTVRQQSVATGAVVGTVLHLSQRVNNITVSPDGKYLVTAEPTGLVRVWRIGGPTPNDFNIVLDGRYSLTRFSPDGRFVFPTGTTFRNGTNSSVRVYDVQSGQPIGPALEIYRPIDADATTEAKLVIVGGASEESKRDSKQVFSGEMATEENQLATQEKEVDDLNRNSILSLLRSKVWVWDPRTGKQPIQPISLRHAIRALKLHPNETEFAVLTADGSVTMYALATGKELRSWKAHLPHFSHQHYINNGALKFDATGRYLATYGPDDRTANIWNPATGKRIAALTHPEGGSYKKVHDVTFSPDGTLAFTSCWSDNAVRSWRLPSGEPAGPPLIHADWPFMADLSPDGKRLVTAGRDRAAHVWDWQSGKEVLAALRHDDEVHGVAFTPDDTMIVSTGDDNAVRFWDTKTGKSLAPPVRTISRALVPALSKDGRFAAIGGQMTTLPVIDLQAKRAAASLAEAEVRSGFRFEGDGLTRLSTAEWRERWAATPNFRAEPIAPAAPESADWQRLRQAEVNSDWLAVLALTERILARQPDNLGLLSRRVRALGESGDLLAAYRLLLNAPLNYEGAKSVEDIALDEFSAVRSLCLLNLKFGMLYRQTKQVDVLANSFKNHKEPKVYSQIPWTWALRNPNFSYFTDRRINPLHDIGFRRHDANFESDLFNLTKKARGSDINEPFYYRVAALVNYRIAFSREEFATSRGALEAGIERIADIEKMGRRETELEEIDILIRALCEYALGRTEEAKVSLERAECLWATAQNDNPTTRKYDWLQRLERELLFEEARRTFKAKPRFANPPLPKKGPNRE